MYGRESEESWAERQKQTAPLPGQEICDCGHVTEREERQRCANCGAHGCIHCMTVIDGEDSDLNDEYVCGPTCEQEYWEGMAKFEEVGHTKLQDYYAKKIEQARKRQVAA